MGRTPAPPPPLHSFQMGMRREYSKPRPDRIEVTTHADPYPRFIDAYPSPITDAELTQEATHRLIHDDSRTLEVSCPVCE